MDGMSSLQTIKHVEKGVPMDGMFCSKTINHVDKMLTPTDGVSCLAQVQMMDIPLQRTINVQP